MTCPSPEDLTRWVNERLDPAEQATVAAHVDCCPRCQTALDALTAEPPAQRPEPDPGFHLLLDRLKETLPGGPPADADPVRPAVPGYDLLEVLGRGGMGVVHRARQRGVNREVAIKLLLGEAADSDAIARFRREGEALGRLRHPNVVQVFDVGVAGGRPFLVMEYVPGGPLSAATDGKPLPPAAAAAIAEGVARAVHHAHEHGILHRDLKPGNILLGNAEVGTGTAEPNPIGGPRGDVRVPKVADFGLARPIDAGQTLTQAGMVVGTPSYMAPEQVSGEERATPACDVYGIGAVLYELLTGRPPFLGSSPADVLLQVRDQDPVPPARVIPTLPRDLNTIALKCLAKDPRKRYPSAGDVAEDLRRWQVGEPIRARPVGPAERAWKWARRRKTAAALVALALFLLVVGLPTATVLWLGADRARRQAAANFDEAERHLYAAHVAQAELQYRLGDVPRMRAHLHACLPAASRPDRRGWEWAYLNGLAYSEHTNLPAPSPPDRRYRTLYAVAYSPDGSRLAAGGGVRSYLINSGREPGELAIWDAAGRPVGAGPAGEPLAVTAVAFAPDGRLFTIGADVWNRRPPRDDRGPVTGPAGLLRARDLRTGAVLFERPFAPPLRGPLGWPESPALAVGPDGSRVAVGSEVGLTVFDGRTGEPLFDRPGGLAAAFAADGSTLWTVELHPRRWAMGWAHWLVAVDPRTGREVTRRDLGPPSATARAFGPTGGIFARLNAEGDVTLTPTRGGPPTTLRLRLPPKEVMTLALSPDERFLAVGGADGTVRVWDVETGRARQVFRGHADRVLSVAFDPSGRRLASAGWDRAVKVWDLDHTPEFIPVGTDAGVRRAEDYAFLSGGRTLRMVRVPGGEVEDWDTVTGTRRLLGAVEAIGLPREMPFPGRSAAIAADGGRVAAVDRADPRRVGVWAAAPFAGLAAFDGCRVRIRFLALNAAGDRLAAVAWDRRDPGRCDLFVWDVDRNAVLVRQALDGEAGTALVVSADGRRVAVGTRPAGESAGPSRLRVWDVDAGREVTGPAPANEVAALAFDRDGSHLAAAVGDPVDRMAAAGSPPRIQIWDARSWAELRSFPCQETYTSLAFAPDGRRLAGGTYELLTLWDPAVGEEMLTLRGRPRGASEPPFNPRVVFDSTGAKLAAAQNDFSVYVWTAAGYGR